MDNLSSKLTSSRLGCLEIMIFVFKCGNTKLLFHISVSCTIYSFFTLIWLVIHSKDEGRWWLKVFTGFSSFFTGSWTIYLHNWRWSTLLSSYQTFFASFVKGNISKRVEKVEFDVSVNWDLITDRYCAQWVEMYFDVPFAFFILLQHYQRYFRFIHSMKVQ